MRAFLNDDERGLVRRCYGMIAQSFRFIEDTYVLVRGVDPIDRNAPGLDDEDRDDDTESDDE